MFHPLRWLNYHWNQIASSNAEHAVCIQQGFQSYAMDLSELLLPSFYKNIKKISYARSQTRFSWCHAYFSWGSVSQSISFLRKSKQIMINIIKISIKELPVSTKVLPAMYTNNVYLHERWCLFINFWIQPLLATKKSWTAGSTFPWSNMASLHESVFGRREARVIYICESISVAFPQFP